MLSQEQVTCSPRLGPFQFYISIKRAMLTLEFLESATDILTPGSYSRSHFRLPGAISSTTLENCVRFLSSKI